MTPPPAAPGRIGRLVVALRWPTLIGWAMGAAVLAWAVPAPPVSGQGGAIQDLIPAGSPALEGQLVDLERFAFPLLARQVVIQRRADGLPVSAQLRTLARALDAGLGTPPPGAAPAAGALPVTNSFGLVHGSAESGTATATFVFFRPEVDAFTRQRATEAYAASLDRPAGTFVGVTGPVAARLEQGDLLLARLGLIELLSVALVVVVAAVLFRSLLAPVLVLATIAVAYVVADRSVALALAQQDASVAPELGPIAVALLVGLVTDYYIFFAAAARVRLVRGEDRRVAVGPAVHRDLAGRRGRRSDDGRGARLLGRRPAGALRPARPGAGRLRARRRGRQHHAPACRPGGDRACRVLAVRRSPGALARRRTARARRGRGVGPAGFGGTRLGRGVAGAGPAVAGDASPPAVPPAPVDPLPPADAAPGDADPGRGAHRRGFGSARRSGGPVGARREPDAGPAWHVGSGAGRRPCRSGLRPRDRGADPAARHGGGVHRAR